MHSPQSIVENETPNYLWDFAIQMDHRVKVNTKGKPDIVDFDIPSDHWVKLKEREKKGKYLELTREMKKQCK